MRRNSTAQKDGNSLPTNFAAVREFGERNKEKADASPNTPAPLETRVLNPSSGSVFSKGIREMQMPEQLYIWRVKARLPDRKGTLCRVLVRGKLNSCLVEFVADGYRAVTSRNYVRKVQ